MPVFEAKVFILDFFHLFDIIGFHTIKFRFPVVVRVHQFTSSPVHQFDYPDRHLLLYVPAPTDVRTVINRCSMNRAFCISEHNQYVGRTAKLNSPVN